MEGVEAKIGNAKQAIFDVTDTGRVYYSVFGYTYDANDNVLPYGVDIQY